MIFKFLNYKLEKIIENIDQTLNQLYQWAAPISIVKNNVKDLTHRIFEHILKLMYFSGNNPTTINHWNQEIFNWLLQCIDQKIKGKNKHPNKEQLYNWMVEACSDAEELKSIMLKLKQDYNVTFTKEEAYENILKVLPKLLQEVTENDDFKRSDIFKIIKGE